MTRGKGPPGIRVGSKNGKAKLSDEDVWIIRRARQDVGWVRNSDPRSLAALAQRFGVQPAAVSKIARGKTWGHHLRAEN